MGAIVILANLWSVFGYSYKAEELTKRLVEVRTNHKFQDLW